MTTKRSLLISGAKPLSAWVRFGTLQQFPRQLTDRKAYRAALRPVAQIDHSLAKDNECSAIIP